MTAKKIQETSQAVEQPVNNDCFIIMPIADHPDYKQGHFKRVYEDILAPACRAAGYKPVRADDTKQANLIQLDILQKLLESPMAICDLSTRNPNVLFELGLRQAFDKPTILVQEEGTPKIFDINIFRYIEYRNGLDYRDVLADQHAIEEVLKETRKAVEEGKSVNSIIKLLSITNPATLQDTSNFGDKEYFQIIMSELASVKNEVRKSQTSVRVLENSHSPINLSGSTEYNYRLGFNRKLNVEERDLITANFIFHPLFTIRNPHWISVKNGLEMLEFKFVLKDSNDLSTDDVKEIINQIPIENLYVANISKYIA